MDKVVVNKQELLDKLVENRLKHNEIFLAAQLNYRQQMITELDRMLKEAREGKRFQRSVTLCEPVDHTKEYDAAIAMLTMSTDGEIQISHNDFAMFVLDDWQWKRNFLTTNSAYVSGLMP